MRVTEVACTYLMIIMGLKYEKQSALYRKTESKLKANSMCSIADSTNISVPCLTGLHLGGEQY